MTARTGNGKPIPQSRILVFQMLGEAGEQGVRSADLLAALMATGLAENSAASRLFKDKGTGLIFGKGEYLVGRGIQYRYFATREWCEAYRFEHSKGTMSARERMRATDRRRWARKRAEETPEQREARLEVARAKAHAKRGIAGVPPKRAYANLKMLTREEFLARDRAYRKARRDAEREKRLAAGENVRTRSANGTSPRYGRRAVKPAPRPGSELVVVLKGTAAPVRTVKRPVLVGEPDMSRARLTVAPVQQDYRYYVDPASVRPVFGAMALGMYLDETEVCDAV